MKKPFAALLCACMTATLLAGCGSKTETTEAPATTEAVTEAATTEAATTEEATTEEATTEAATTEEATTEAATEEVTTEEATTEEVITEAATIKAATTEAVTEEATTEEATTEEATTEEATTEEATTEEATTEESTTEEATTEEATTEEATTEEATTEEVTTEAATTEAESETETEAAGADLKIAIVTSPSGVDDRNFNQNNYNGILAFIEENPDSTVTPVREETGDVAAAVQAVADIVADYDAIVCCGFQFAGITTIAQENPDVDFILVDAYPTDPESETGDSIVVDNIYAMQFKEQEAGFCAGMAAALETTTGKVAVVNGIAYPSNVNYQYGFMSGVNFANKYYGAKAEIVELPSYAGTDVTGANVGGNYIGSFSDEATGKVVGKALIDAGVDVILVAAGNSGNGVFTAAKEAEGVLCIAGDVDQYDDGVNGDGNIILTSVLKVMDMNVELQLNKIKDGTFAGENALLGADTDSTGFVSEEGRCQLSAETIADMEEAFEKVKSGEVVPAANFNGLTPDAFTGL